MFSTARLENLAFGLLKGEGAALLSSFWPERVGRASLLSAAQGAVGAVSIFGALKLLIVRDGLEEVGLWSLCMGIITIIRVADIFNSASLQRLVVASGKSATGKSQLIDTVTIATLIYYLCAIALGTLMFPLAIELLVETEEAKTAHALIPWLLVSLFLLVMMTSQANALDGLHRSDVRAKALIGGQIGFGALSLMLIPRYGVFGLAAAQAIQYGLVMLFIRWRLAIELESLSFLPKHFSRLALIEATGFSTRLQIAAIPTLIYEPIARVLINLFGGLATLAIYDLAYKLCSYARLMMEAASRPLIPEFARSVEDRAQVESGLFNKAMKITLWSTVAIYASIILSSPIVSLIMLGSVQWSFLFSLIILSAAWATAGFALIPKIYARAKGIMRWNIACEWTVAVTTIILTLILGGLQIESALIVIGPAVAIAAGNALGFWGNLRVAKSARGALRPV